MERSETIQRSANGNKVAKMCDTPNPRFYRRLGDSAAMMSKRWLDHHYILGRTSYVRGLAGQPVIPVFGCMRPIDYQFAIAGSGAKSAARGEAPAE